MVVLSTRNMYNLFLSTSPFLLSSLSCFRIAATIFRPLRFLFQFYLLQPLFSFCLSPRPPLCLLLDILGLHHIDSVELPVCSAVILLSDHFQSSDLAPTHSGEIGFLPPVLGYLPLASAPPVSVFPLFSFFVFFLLLPFCSFFPISLASWLGR